MRAVTLPCVFPAKFLRLPSDASHAQRFDAAREICFVQADEGCPSSAGTRIAYHKFRPGNGNLAKISIHRSVRALSAGIRLMADKYTTMVWKSDKKTGELETGSLEGDEGMRKKGLSVWVFELEMLPVWKCCQYQCCQFPIGEWGTGNGERV